MGWKPIHFGLAIMMVVFGTFNTLSVKWADKMESPSTDGVKRHFNHPFLQACAMFLGEMLCMVAFWIVRWRQKRQPQITYPPLDDPSAPKKFNPFIFLPPALCDMTATSIQYLGLTLTYASSFQMLRGAVIIFTGILSTIFLKRKLQWFKWLGMGLVIGGLVTVGANDLINGNNSNSTTPTNGTGPASFLWSAPTTYTDAPGNDTKDNSDVILGDILIFCSQIIVATQMVLEEKFVSKYNVPALQAVGWEGTFGFTMMALLLIPFSFIYVGPRFGDNPRMVLEDPYDGVYQLAHNPELALAFCGTIVSIAFFNFAGISVTKELSATTRMVLDSIRTISIWMVSIAIGWQQFFLLQLIGFGILLTGMCFYNDILFLPLCRMTARRLGLCGMGNPYTDMEEEEEEQDQDQDHQGHRNNLGVEGDGEPVFSSRPRRDEE